MIQLSIFPFATISWHKYTDLHNLILDVIARKEKQNTGNMSLHVRFGRVLLPGTFFPAATPSRAFEQSMRGVQKFTYHTCLSRRRNQLFNQGSSGILQHKYSKMCYSSASAKQSSGAGEGEYEKHLNSLRNCAVIAHVDHGKTTLVDQLLQQSGAADTKQDRVMDSIDQERERGITIMSKNTSVLWNNHRLNIVDTPGHADFGGEVERVLSMVDGVLLVVDATEGPMTQTKFVLSKALKHNLTPVVVINKVDRDTARLDGSVEDELFDLFLGLEATDEQMEFPIIYASGRDGWAVTDLENERKDIMPLFDAIVKHIPTPKVDQDSIGDSSQFRMMVTNMEYDQYLGRLVSGKVYSGYLKPGDVVKALSRTGETTIQEAKVTKLFRRYGVLKEEIKFAQAGDIVTLSGVEASVSDTVCNKSVDISIDTLPIDPPLLSLSFSTNTSPLMGKAGEKSKLTSNAIKDRLEKETENNVTVSIEHEAGDSVCVKGRGEMQLGIVIEQMRREGYELTISSPKVLMKVVDGKLHEPFEDLIIDVPEKYSGKIIENLQMRGAEMKNMQSQGDSFRLEFYASSKALLGFRSEAKIVTGGEATVNGVYSGHFPAEKKAAAKSVKGKIYSTCDGTAQAYTLQDTQTRGELFVKHGDPVYKGMLLGENNKMGDLDVNVTKAKKSTNMRASGHDEAINVRAPRAMTLEDCISYISINGGHVIEVTPDAIRLRKTVL